MRLFRPSHSASSSSRAHNHDSSTSSSPPSAIFLHLSQHLHQLERLLLKGRSSRRGRLRVEECARACHRLWEQAFGVDGWEHHSTTINNSTAREFVIHLCQKARRLHIDSTGETATFVTYQLLTEWANEINLTNSLLAEQQLFVDLLQTEYQANHNYTYHTLKIHRISSSSTNEYARQAARLKVELANERDALAGGVWLMKIETKRFEELNGRYT